MLATLQAQLALACDQRWRVESHAVAPLVVAAARLLRATEEAHSSLRLRDAGASLGSASAPTVDWPTSSPSRATRQTCTVR